MLYNKTTFSVLEWIFSGQHEWWLTTIVFMCLVGVYLLGFFRKKRRPIDDSLLAPTIGLSFPCPPPLVSGWLLWCGAGIEWVEDSTNPTPACPSSKTGKRDAVPCSTLHHGRVGGKRNSLEFPCLIWFLCPKNSDSSDVTKCDVFASWLHPKRYQSSHSALLVSLNPDWLLLTSVRVHHPTCTRMELG